MPIPGFDARKALETERSLKNHIQWQANTIRSLDTMVEELYVENRLLKPIAIKALNLINTIDVSEKDGNYFSVTGEQTFKELIDRVQEWQVKVYKKD